MSSESAITASAPAEIAQTPAASPSTPSIRLITLITATIPMIVSTWPRWTLPSDATSKSSTDAQVDAADERQREVARVDAVEDRDRRGDRLPGQLQQRLELVDVVDDADDVITTAPTSSAWVCSAQGRKRIVATAIATKIARPPSFGVGSVWRLRSFG